jgi:TonB family protein
MIAAWMLDTLLFSAFVGLAALSGDTLLASRRRPRRVGWFAALAVVLAWPLATLTSASLRARALVVAPMPPIRVVQFLPVGTPGPSHTWLPQLDQILLLAWMSASAVLLVRLAVSVRQTRTLMRSAAVMVVDGTEVLVSDLAGPAVVGLLRPQVILSREVTALDPDLRSLVLRHEEEHRRAGDSWGALVCALGPVALPWNAPLWWIVRRARLAVEIDCDDRVLRSGVSPRRYGKLLLFVAQRHAHASLVPALVSTHTQLERRIHAMLLDPSIRRRRHAVLGVAGLLMAGIAACSAHITDGGSPARAAATRVEPTAAMFEFQVEKPALPLPGSAHPAYPADLRDARTEGTVLAQFVVDESGRTLPETFKVLRSSHVEFSEAVRVAIPTMRFTPAEMGGRAVRQLVQQPFTFSLTKS